MGSGAHLLGRIRSPIVSRKLHADCVASGNMQCLAHVLCRMSPLAARQRWGIGRVSPVLAAPTRGCKSITCVLRRHGQDLGQANGGGGEARQVLRVRHPVHDAAGAASFPVDRHCQSCSCHPSTKLSSTRLLCLIPVTCVGVQQLRASVSSSKILLNEFVLRCGSCISALAPALQYSRRCSVCAFSRPEAVLILMRIHTVIAGAAGKDASAAAAHIARGSVTLLNPSWILTNPF